MSEFRNRYIFKGQFYNTKINRKKVKCRRTLSIKSVNSNKNKYDLLVVMMNPGSSRPLDEHAEIEEINNYESIREVKYLSALPDRTQYQICKVMDNCEFENALIINLSDIRESKSQLFFAHIKTESIRKANIHSIFHIMRKEELDDLLLEVSSEAPVVLGFGVSNKLDPLIDLYNKSIIVDNYNTYSLENKKGRILHPLPQMYNKQTEWVQLITDKIEK